MSNIISRMFVSLGLKNENFKNGLKDSEKQTKSFGKTIGAIGGMIAGAFAIGKLTSFFKESFKLYGIQEDAERKLRAQIEANGKAAQSTLDEYKKFASGLQAVTTVGDETSLGLLQVAESMGATTQQAKDAVKGSIGLSKAFGISMDTALRGAILAQQGQYEMLQRYIPTLRTASTEAEKHAILQKAMADGFKVATAEAGSSIGRLTQLSNTYGDLREKIGQAIGESNIFKTALSELRGLLASLGSDVDKDGAENIFESWEKQGLLTAEFINDQIDKIGNQVTKLGDSKLQILEENKWEDIQKRFLGMETSGDVLNKQIEDRLKLADLLNAKLKEIKPISDDGDLIKPEVRSIETLKAEIKEYQDASKTATGADLVFTNNRITALKEELKVLKELKFVKGVDNFASTGITKPDAIQSSHRNPVPLPNQKEVDRLKSQLAGLKISLLLADGESEKAALKSQISAFESKLIAEETGFEIPVKLTTKGTLANSKGFKAMQDSLRKSLLETQNQVMKTQNAMNAYGSVMGSVGQIAADSGDQQLATIANVVSTTLQGVAQIIAIRQSEAIANVAANALAAPWYLSPGILAAGLATVASIFGSLKGGFGGGGGGGAAVTSIDTRGVQSPTTNRDGMGRSANLQTQNVKVEVVGTIKGKDIALANNQGQKQLKR